MFSFAAALLTSKSAIPKTSASARQPPPTEGYMAQVQAINAWSSAERLEALDVPTLIIHGESDQLIPPENAGLLWQKIRGSDLVMLPRASHIFTTDQPEKAHEAILQFLK